ncbi:hypothetical protein FB451DRAFT_638354 [Mycena latifolia]|nr:hypothetical protein FB451DRAFT_638354 [Mycena latifolia]
MLKPPNLRNLWNGLRRRRRTTVFSVSLPLEVWELVFEQLSDEGLKTAACVCSAFNDRCIVLYLGRHDIHPDTLATGALRIHSPLLSVLQLSRLAPQIHTLVCRFWAFRVLRDMKLLRDFIRRSHSIKELHLSFADDLLHAYTIDTIFPYSPHTLATEFCDVIRAMVAKTVAPVVVIIAGHIYRVRPSDLERWGFRYFFPWTLCLAHIAWVDRAWYALHPEHAEPHILLPVWSEKGIRCPEALGSVSVRCVPTAAGPLTLITFEKDAALSLTLGPSLYDDAIPSAELSIILPFITLTSLRNLYIEEDVDRAALHEFLLRHPTIASIWHEAKETDRNLSQGGLLTSSPLVLPSLADIACVDIDQLIPLLNSFGLSPRLAWIGIRLSRDTAPQVAALKRGLRRLSLHTTPTELHISPSRDESGGQLPIDIEERQILGCLYCVRWVHMCVYNVSGVQSLIPWLAMLPALARLKFSIWSHRGPPPDGDATASALEAVRVGLPWVLVETSP